MNKQITLSALTDELAQAKTKKREFLKQMNRIIPWEEWMGIIKPHDYKGERGNKPYELETMLRIHLHDVTMVPKLLYGEEISVYGDSGYLGAEKRKDAITHNPCAETGWL